MENRTQVVQEYLQLRVRLNKANKLSNQVTELDFRIVPTKKKGLFRFEAFLQGNAYKQFFVLCCWDQENNWRSGGYSGLNALEEFCEKKLNELVKTFYLNLHSEHSRLAVEEMKKELRSLGIRTFEDGF